jgi:DNA-binding HxlR family transcriptional regulator
MYVWENFYINSCKIISVSRQWVELKLQISKLLLPQYESESDNWGNIQNYAEHHIGHKIQDQTTNLKICYKSFSLNSKQKTDPHIDNEKLNTAINDVRNNDKKILSVLRKEMWSTYSFKALERKLDIHQQSLSRALKRLLDLNLIEKTSSGYKLVERSAYNFNPILEDNLLNEELEKHKSKKHRKYKQLVQIYMTVKGNIEPIVDHLTGKWFGNLRWFGLIKKETGFRLQWIVVDKHSNNKIFQINVNILSEYIIVESDAVSDSEKVEAMYYSNRIIEEIIKILQENLLEVIPEKEYTPVYTNDIKFSPNRNN